MPFPAAAQTLSNLASSDIRERIIVALDVPSADEARRVVGELSDCVGAFKIGMQLFTAAGPAFVTELTERGEKIFLDLKFHDIPNTVSAAGVEAAKLGVWMFNVHASGGGEMMLRCRERVAEYCDAHRTQRPVITAVTVLTSSTGVTLSETGVHDALSDQVGRLSRLAFEAGLDGVVASANEVAIVRHAVTDPEFITVTPGIRRPAATNDDQKRVTTIGRAFAAGSNFVVIGRPILTAPKMRQALDDLVEEAGQDQS